MSHCPSVVRMSIGLSGEKKESDKIICVNHHRLLVLVRAKGHLIGQKSCETRKTEEFSAFISSFQLVLVMLTFVTQEGKIAVYNSEQKLWFDLYQSRTNKVFCIETWTFYAESKKRNVMSRLAKLLKFNCKFTAKVGGYGRPDLVRQIFSSTANHIMRIAPSLCDQFGTQTQISRSEPPPSICSLHTISIISCKNKFQTYLSFFFCQLISLEHSSDQPFCKKGLKRFRSTESALLYGSH